MVSSDMTFLGKIASPCYAATGQSQYHMAIGKDSGLTILCHSSRYVCLQRVLKTFPGSDYFYSEDGVVRQWQFVVNLDIYDSPFYPATAQSQSLTTIGRDSSLRTLCYSCRYACQ